MLKKISNRDLILKLGLSFGEGKSCIGTSSAKRPFIS